MKRITALFLALIFTIFTVGCRKNPKNDYSSAEPLNSGIIKVDITEDDSSKTNSEDTSSVDKNTSSKNDDKNNSSKTEGSVSNNQGKPNNSSNQNSSGSKNENSQASSNESSNNTSSGSDKNTSSDSCTEDTVTNPEDNTATKPSDSNQNDNSLEEYSKIECRSIENNNWKKIELVINSNKFYARLSIPTDWEISSDGTIKRNDIPIGKISSKAPDSSVNSFEESQRGQDNDTEISVRQSIEKYTKMGINSYERHYKISRLRLSGGFTLYLWIDYAQLNSSASLKLYNSISYLGTERYMPEKKNNTDKLLILGNELISPDYSKLGIILNEMFSVYNTANSTNHFAEVISNQGANISTYAQNTELIQKIKDKTYDYVLLCGFYNTDTSDIEEDFNKIAQACKSSDTGLIIFPAYNESSAVITTLLNKNEALYCIDWKKELEELKDSGIGGESQLVLEDFYKDGKTTPLAGYVGAHMIYRNILKTNPNEINFDFLTTETIKEKLKGYVSTGIIPGREKITKYYI